MSHGLRITAVQLFINLLSFDCLKVFDILDVIHHSICWQHTYNL